MHAQVHVAEGGLTADEDVDRIESGFGQNITELLKKNTSATTTSVEDNLLNRHIDASAADNIKNHLYDTFTQNSPSVTMKGVFTQDAPSVTMKGMQVFDEDSKNRIKTVLAQSIERDINDLLYWKYKFKKIGDYCETFSQVTTLFATVVAFAAGYTDEKLLSFIAGSLGSISLALLKASAYSHGEAKERTEQLNTLLVTSNLN